MRANEAMERVDFALGVLMKVAGQLYTVLAEALVVPLSGPTLPLT